MKRLLRIGGALTALLGGSALAADLGVQPTDTRTVPKLQPCTNKVCPPLVRPRGHAQTPTTLDHSNVS